MAYGRNYGSYANGGDAALAGQITQLTREREQRNWERDQQERMRRQQVKDANAQAFYEAGQRPRQESGPTFLATDDGLTGHVVGADFIPSQADSLASRNQQMMDAYRMQGVQTRAAQKERENLQNVALCGMIQSAQQNGGFVDPSMLGMVNQQLGDGSVKCIGGDTDGKGNLRIYGETGNGVRGIMMTLSKQQQAALMGKTPGVEGGQAFVERYVAEQIGNGMTYEDAMKSLGLDPGKAKSGASAAMRGERAASGGRASAQEKFDKEWFEHLAKQIDDLDETMADEKFASKPKDEQDRIADRRNRYMEMLNAYENHFAARYPTAKQQKENLKLQSSEAKAALAAQEKELRQIDAALKKQAFDAAFQNGRLAGSGSWRGADGEEVLKYNGRRYAVGEAVDFGNGVKATWLGGGIEPENFELVVEEEEPAPGKEGVEEPEPTQEGGAQGESGAGGTEKETPGDGKANSPAREETSGQPELSDGEIAALDKFFAGIETPAREAKRRTQEAADARRKVEQSEADKRRNATADRLAGVTVLGSDLGAAARIKPSTEQQREELKRERDELFAARNAAFGEAVSVAAKKVKDSVMSVANSSALTEEERKNLKKALKPLDMIPAVNPTK